MKRLENILLKACFYAVLIVTLFFLFTLMTSFTEAAIKIDTFMLILLFGLIIALADLVFKIEKINFALRLLIHYASLLITFVVIFVVSGKITGAGGGAVISAVFIFTVLYAVIFLLVYFGKKSLRKAERGLDKKMPQKTREKKQYKSLYGKDQK